MNVRDAAIGVATRMFAERGFEATAVQDIARELDISKQALLYHFKSKEALKLALIDALVEDADRRFRAILAAISNAPDASRLAPVVDHLERYLEEEPHAAPALLRFVLDRDTAAIDRMQQSLHPWLAYISDQLRRGQKAGVVRPELTAQMLFTQIGLLVIGYFSTLPLGDWGTKRPGKARNRQRLRQLLETIGWVVFPDERRPVIFQNP